VREAGDDADEGGLVGLGRGARGDGEAEDAARELGNVVDGQTAAAARTDGAIAVLVTTMSKLLGLWITAKSRTSPGLRSTRANCQRSEVFSVKASPREVPKS
jgi:hypothetical protein